MPAGAPRVRFGIILLPESLSEFGSTCREAEDAGFELLGVADSQSVFREAYVSLTLAALATRRVRLGPLVSNPVTRHPVVTASAISSLDEIAGGRAVLGLGSGDSALYTVGAPPATRADLEEAVDTANRLTAGESVKRGGNVWRVRHAKRRVPVYLAAEGPQTLRLAARVADGIIVGLGLTPDVVRLCWDHIEAGAREAGRRVEDIDVWWLVKTNVAESRAAALEPIKMALAASANHAFRFTLEGKGLDPDLHEQVRGLRKEYEPHHHEVLGATPNAGLTDRWGLTDYLADRFAIAGTPEECAAAARSAAAAGASQLLLTGFVREPRRFIERWGREVVPRAGGDGGRT
jgi:5,10-methylenetetrahydromethanopterin reductase